MLNIFYNFVKNKKTLFNRLPFSLLLLYPYCEQQIFFYRLSYNSDSSSHLFSCDTQVHILFIYFFLSLSDEIFFYMLLAVFNINFIFSCNSSLAKITFSRNEFWDFYYSSLIFFLLNFINFSSFITKIMTIIMKAIK